MLVAMEARWRRALKIGMNEHDELNLPTVIAGSTIDLRRML